MDTSPISTLYFANPDDGYAEEYPSTGQRWASTALFLTLNGGRTWERASLASHATVYGLASSSRYFYAISEQCTAKGECDHIQLNRSKVGTTHWTKLVIPREVAKYGGGIQVSAFGSSLWLSTQNQVSAPYSPYVATSLDDGASFTVAVQPQLTSAGSCGLLPVSEQVLWAECDEGNMQGEILYSRDGGSRWQFDQSNQLGRFDFGVFDPVSKSATYFINEMYPRTLFRTSSEAATPRAVGTMPGNYYWVSLDMTNARQGLALSQGPGGSSLYILWRTADGGTSWSRVAL
jgi:hypothetical protein